MTTNQTIDGVPRELKPCPFCGGSADLKCTEGDYPDWFVQCTECHASVDVFGPGAVHHWNDRKLPAVQPQGEPVAWAWVDEKGEHGVTLRWDVAKHLPYFVKPLYAEQPAPVVVVTDCGACPGCTNGCRVDRESPPPPTAYDEFDNGVD